MPPYSSGMVMPNMPISAMPAVMSSGMPSSASSMARARGSRFLTSHSRMAWRYISCSVV